MTKTPDTKMIGDFFKVQREKARVAKEPKANTEEDEEKMMEGEEISLPWVRKQRNDHTAAYIPSDWQCMRANLQACMANPSRLKTVQ
jgi:hypothetical protein